MNPDDIMAAAQHARDVYCNSKPDSQTDQEFLKELYGDRLVAFLDCPLEDTQGMVVLSEIDPDMVEVVFRGTKEPKDILTDLKFCRRSLITCPEHTLFDGISVHRGFLCAYAPAQSQLERILADLKKGQVRFEGHSLGAALSVLAAADEFGRNRSGVSIINFGQPRVTNAAGAKLIGEKIKSYIRVVNGPDPVPLVPTLFMGYRHAVPATYTSLTLVDGLSQAWHQSRAKTVVQFHYMDRYIDRLQEKDSGGE